MNVMNAYCNELCFVLLSSVEYDIRLFIKSESIRFDVQRLLGRGVSENDFSSLMSSRLRSRLCCTDGSEFLFLADTSKEMEEWVNKITFHAQLPPSLQLLSYDDNQKVSLVSHTHTRYSLVLRTALEEIRRRLVGCGQERYESCR